MEAMGGGRRSGDTPHKIAKKSDEAPENMNRSESSAAQAHAGPMSKSVAPKKKKVPVEHTRNKDKILDIPSRRKSIPFLTAECRSVVQAARTLLLPPPRRQLPAIAAYAGATLPPCRGQHTHTRCVNEHSSLLCRASQRGLAQSAYTHTHTHTTSVPKLSVFGGPIDEAGEARITELQETNDRGRPTLQGSTAGFLRQAAASEANTCRGGARARTASLGDDHSAERTECSGVTKRSIVRFGGPHTYRLNYNTR